MSSLSYRVSRRLCGEWAGGYAVVAHKILVSAPVPWIGDLGIGDGAWQNETYGSDVWQETGET